MPSTDQLIGSGYYEDMLRMPHHVSVTRPHMPLRQRAAQFASFDALQGFKETVAETRRRTDEEWLPDPDILEMLTLKIRYLADIADCHPPVTVTYFVPDMRKAGGTYVTAAGKLKKIDMPFRRIILLADNGISNGLTIELDRISDLASPELPDIYE